MSYSHEYIADHIVTRREIARLHHVPLRTVHGWAERRKSNGFPKPLRLISRSGGQSGAPIEIYWYPEIYNWYATYIPKRGQNHNGSITAPSVGS